MAKETKKTNKKTLGAVFCALSLGVAGVTGLMLNDANKKYDVLKKDNAVQIEQYKTEKTALQTQLATKQAQLEQLQADATANASQIAQLESEIQTLENQLDNVEYINKNLEDATLTYLCESIDINGFLDSNYHQVHIQNGNCLDASTLDNLSNMNVDNFLEYSNYYLMFPSSTIDVNYHHPRFFWTSIPVSVLINYVDLNGQTLEIEENAFYIINNFTLVTELYTEEEKDNLNYETSQDLYKSINLTIMLEKQQG